MSEGEKREMAEVAIILLALISFSAIVAGIVLAYFHSPVDGIAPIVAGATGGIVAIVLREKNGS